MAQRFRRTRRVLLAGLLLCVLANAAAFLAAWSLTHFSRPSPRAPGGRLWARTVAAAVLGGGRLPRTPVGPTPARFGLPYERHVFTAPDGTRREAWYVPQDRWPASWTDI